MLVMQMGELGSGDDLEWGLSKIQFGAWVIQHARIE